MINIILALALTIATIARAQTPGTNGTVLRDLAGSRFYGAAANTSFLFIDPVYTGVISTQVRPLSPESNHSSCLPPRWSSTDVVNF